MIKQAFACGAAFAALMLTSGGAYAQTDLIVNGDFELTSGHASGQFDTAHPYVNVTAWVTNGYNFIFNAGTADTTGAYSSQYHSPVILWGPANGSNNGLTAASPTGGNYVGADGAFHVGAIEQVVSGLTVGQNYQVNFYWAGAQQYDLPGDNTEQFQVSLGSDAQLTSIVSNPTGGFSGWRQQSFVYTASAASETLSFLAIGTPDGVPPFALLDGVSMFEYTAPPVTITPEPGAMALAAAAVAGFGTVLRRRRSRP